MSNWVCLRDCFTSDRYYYEGRLYDLPDAMYKNPKNFRLQGEGSYFPKTSTIATTVVKVDLNSPKVETSVNMEPPPVEPTVEIPKKEFKCSVCGKVVRTALGLSGHSRSHKEKKDVSTN